MTVVNRMPNAEYRVSNVVPRRRWRCCPTAQCQFRLLVLALLLLPTLGLSRRIRVADEEIPVRREAGVEYVPLSRLVQALNGKSWRVHDRFVVVLPGDSLNPEQEFVFWVDSNLVRVRSQRAEADQEILLPMSSRLDQEQLYLPVFGLADVFPELVSTVPVLRLADVSENGDTLVIRFETEGDSVAWYGEIRSSLEYRLVVGARCDSVSAQQLGIIPILAANGLVQTARLNGVIPESASGGQNQRAGTVIHFMFRQPAGVEMAADSTGLVVRVWPKPQRRVRRVVVDPGHGGKDPGAVGQQGTLEKTIVMDVSRRLKKKLEVQGFEVLLTRSRDEYVSLSSRSKYANEHKVDLFISIHANAAPNKQACGFETYFLSEAKTDWERAVAARENAALEFEMQDSPGTTDELELILADLAQNEFLCESSELAACIQEKTVPHARIKDRGVRQANFFVLRNNYMPAVLVECGFLSNRSEEKLLRNPAHRERVAEGVCRGVVKFVKQYEQRINGS